MTSKHYKWQLKWTVSPDGSSATHETGLIVRRNLGGRLTAEGEAKVIEALRPKNGHNAEAMVRRLINTEARQLLSCEPRR